MPAQPRRSVFREEGLEDLEHSVHQLGHHAGNTRSDMPAQYEHDQSRQSDTLDGSLTQLAHKENVEHAKTSHNRSPSWHSRLMTGSRPKLKASASAPPASFSTMPRMALIVFLIALVVPGFRYGAGWDKSNINGAAASVMLIPEIVENRSAIEGRADSPTAICTRWAHMTAMVNGTLYIYGGQAKTASGQTTNTWNNNLLTLDVTKSWEISSPSLTGLPRPSGPPAVALGSLWHSYESLFLYGGQFSDSPITSPLPMAVWEYNIQSAAWIEHSNPQTSAGNASDAGGQPVQRAAEGAGISVPELGRSWYFGGHLDLYTTEGWSNQIARVYLKSMLEFTHPGYANNAIDSLGSTKAAPAGGVYRNITEGGLQDEASFTERADGSLVYIPGWGTEGIILGLAGGTNTSFTEMNIIDIYDIANSTWYKQSTTGTSPPIRVNQCTVVAAAPDGTSFNVYLYGGQNLIPYGEQIQYSDMWILTIPSFTWIEVDMKGQSKPPARAGHTCNIWDGQMVVVGGYVGTDISCDSPGVYVFNTSSLQWTTSFTALSGSPFSSGSDSSDSGSNENQAENQVAKDSSVLQGSYGYLVPREVQSIIGGSSEGGATATQPAAGSALAGPIATGKPPTFTVTQSGSTVIQTAQSTSTGSSGASTDKAGKKNTGAIVASVIAGVLGCLAVYLAFCTWLYRRQLGLYKNHVAMAQRTSFNNSPDLRPSYNDAGEVVASPSAPHSETGMRMSQLSGAMLGPFAGRHSGSAGRPSLGESGSALTPTGSNVTPASTIPVDSGHASGQGSIYGAGTLPGPKNIPYGRMSEEGAHLAPSVSTAHSSMDDLLGGQEPSFFQVVLNPRRTLRVVNSD